MIPICTLYLCFFLIAPGKKIKIKLRYSTDERPNTKIVEDQLPKLSSFSIVNPSRLILSDFEISVKFITLYIFLNQH